MKFLTTCLCATLISICSANAAISEADYRHAASKAYGEADQLLNAIYQKLMAVLGADDIAELKKSQRVWVAQRDAKAAKVADEWKGTNMLNRFRDREMRTLTIERYAELLNLYYDNYAVALDPRHTQRK